MASKQRRRQIAWRRKQASVSSISDKRGGVKANDGKRHQASGAGVTCHLSLTAAYHEIMASTAPRRNDHDNMTRKIMAA